MFLVGFILILIFEARKVKGSMILSIIIVTLLGIPLEITHLPTSYFNAPRGFGSLVGGIDILGALKLQYFPWPRLSSYQTSLGPWGLSQGLQTKLDGLIERGTCLVLKKV